MAEFIKMPTLGFDMEEGTMGAWLKEVGDDVAKGDILAEIESDKVTQELQARAEGVLLAQLANPGDLVPVGANLGIIGAEGEDIEAMLAEVGGNGAAPAAKKEEAAPEKETAAPEAAPSAKAAEPSKPSAVSEEYPGGVKATPVARRVAQEHSVDLKQVSGSGPDGRIRKADVEAFVERGPQKAAAPEVVTPTAPTFKPTSVPIGDQDTVLEVSRLRKTIARRMTESKVTVPHFYITNEIDMAAALDLRKQVNATLPDDNKVTVNDLVVKAAALALRDFPNLNAAYAGDQIVHYADINVGSAVAVEGGLLTVVQKNTDTSTLSKVAADHKAMIGRAREGKVQPDDIIGSTFTVSNLGAFDVDHFIAIINPPNAAILAIGSAQQVPVVVDGELTVGTRMKATISADHRVTDGVEAARYMQAFKALLENPLRLLL
jgi:pyruvate dehydrogenase E2 component (dihydrolipoamide acetyltransferase)